MKQLKITVNGKSYDVMVEEVGTVASAPVAAPAAAPAPAPAPTAAPAAAPAAETAPAPAPVASPASAEGTPVNSPMPGTILDVKVSAGQQVKNGDTLVVLEAMKMENEIKADKDGTIAAVFVRKGDTVDSGSALVSIQ